MPLLSLILPVYQVAEYLPHCLDSIFAQAGPEVEVVAVDDGSDDGSAEILGRYASRHPALRVVTLERNGGLGAARNVGIAHARGRYVWCVDSDDWLPEGTLAAVTGRLRQLRPDVLITGYARVYPDGLVEHHPVTAAAAYGVLPEVFTFADQPGLLDVLWIACNKVIRRDFLAEHGLTFSPGWYEDISFVVPLLLAAGRISALDRYCYAYRQRPAGAITRTVSPRHLEVFDQWDRVFAFIDAHPDRYGDLRPVVFQRSIWHCLQVLGHASRVPGPLRREFFARVAAQYRRHLPPGGAALPTGREGVKQRLVALGAYRLFELLTTGWQLHRRVRAVATTAATPAVTSPSPASPSPALVSPALAAPRSSVVTTPAAGPATAEVVTTTVRLPESSRLPEVSRVPEGSG